MKNFDEILHAHDRDMALINIKDANTLFVEFNKLQTEAIKNKAISMARDLVLHYIVDKHPAI